MPRIIGDVHGKIDKYINIALGSVDGYSIQVGDMGFDYSKLSAINPNYAKFIPGNHDNYNVCFNEPHCITSDTGNFHFGNAVLGKYKFFFIRGERSIDESDRILGRDFFYEEELNYDQSIQLINCYTEAKPDVVISHGCPESIIIPMFGQAKYKGQLIKPSSTAHLLQACFEIHQPKHWFFGHYHKTKCFKKNKTQFLCLAELNYIDVE